MFCLSFESKTLVVVVLVFVWFGLFLFCPSLPFLVWCVISICFTSFLNGERRVCTSGEDVEISTRIYHWRGSTSKYGISYGNKTHRPFVFRPNYTRIFPVESNSYQTSSNLRFEFKIVTSEVPVPEGLNDSIRFTACDRTKILIHARRKSSTVHGTGCTLHTINEFSLRYKLDR